MVELIRILLIMFLVAIFVRSILSWFPISQYNPLKVMVFKITEPVLNPLRRYLPTFGAFDLAPLVVIIVIWFLLGILTPASSE